MNSFPCATIDQSFKDSFLVCQVRFSSGRLLQPGDVIEAGWVFAQHLRWRLE